MKKFFSIILFYIILNFANNLLAKQFNIGDQINNYFNFNKDISIELTSGNWTVVRSEDYIDEIKQRIVGIARVENNEVMEIIEVYEGLLAGYFIGYVDPILIELVFKGEHDGCYERPEYFLVEFYRKGSTFNCMVIRHMDVRKELKYPDDPEGKLSAASYNNWIKQTSVKYPKIMFESNHTYFSRLVGGNWYSVIRLANPKLLNAPETKFFTEEKSEYHKYNISNYPKHNDAMNQWISISADFHQFFEEMVKAKNRHKLSLENYSANTQSFQINQNDNIVDQIKKLKELMDNGVITNKEFEKAKKKLLN